MEEIMENIGEENKEDFLHDLRILYLNIFYPLTERDLSSRSANKITLVIIQHSRRQFQNKPPNRDPNPIYM
jgi:hypothetical protein